MPERTLSEQLDDVIGTILTGAGVAESNDPMFSRLVKIAGRLPAMPDDNFKNWLGRELHAEIEGRRSMTTKSSVETSAPEFAAIHTITPFISVPEGGKLIEFMKHTFGAEETDRHPHHGPDGFVAGVRIGDSDLIVMGGESLRGQECTAALHVYVKDCDAAYRRALDAGAVTIGGPGVGKPADRPYGERAAFVSDPFGNYWFIATRFVPNPAARLGDLTACLLPSNAAPLTDFLKRAFGAEIDGYHEEEGAWCTPSFISERLAEAQETHRPFGFYLHTDDVDSVYRKAMAAGAVSIVPPADQPFGDRLAIVQDPAGNSWFAAKRIVR